MKFVPAVFAVELAMLHLIVQTQGSDQLFLLGLSVSVAALVLSCCQTCDRRDSLPLTVKHRQDLIKILGIWPCSQFWFSLHYFCEVRKILDFLCVSSLLDSVQKLMKAVCYFRFSCNKKLFKKSLSIRNNSPLDSKNSVRNGYKKTENRRKTF